MANTNERWKVFSPKDVPDLTDLLHTPPSSMNSVIYYYGSYETNYKDVTQIEELHD